MDGTKWTQLPGKAIKNHKENNPVRLRYLVIPLILFMALLSGCKGRSPITPGLNTPLSSQQLSLVINLDKSTYQLGDSITSTIKIKNRGVSTKINVRFAEQCLYHPLDENWEISFLILDSKGQQYTEPRCAIVDWADPWYIQLNKGDEYKHPYKYLLDFYPLKDPGKYTIQAIYHNVYSPSDVWKGEIRSNVETLTINP